MGVDKQVNINFNVNADTSQVKQKFSGIFDQMKKDVDNTQKEFNKLQDVIRNLEVPAKFKKGLEGITSQIESEIKNFKSLTENGLNNLGESKKAEQSVNKITELYRKLKIEVNDITGIDIEKLLPKEFVARVKGATDAWNKFVKVYNSIGKENQAIQDTNDKLKEQAKIIDELQQKQKNYKPSDNSELNKQRFAEAQHQKSLEKQQHDIAIERDRISGDRNYKTKLERQDDIKKLENDYKSLGEQIEESKRKQADFTKQIEENKKIGENLDKARQEYAELEKQLKQLTEAAQAGKIEEFRESLAQALNLPNKEELPKTFEELQTYINNLEVGQAQKITEQLKQLGPAAEGGAEAVGKLKENTDKAGEGFRELSQREKEIEQFANRIKYFFSIGNTVMLFRRAIKSAIDTVKELDEVMTQAAVVTKFTVADMWAQLPQYAQRANELGVTIKGVYEASTLYYQQGLDTIEVIGVANETLKMAKIAGIDYATATDYMTSALRGFNMEVNELSAQKVNDIYSQLAAKTASNVEEISVAMSKTAPLAHNAGMEIETTAALLAQMIERTREAPETLGTAMKTVIARFQELKKDPALIEPIEGEIVDANKVETALRTIGVSLRDTSGQFRNLDEVFLEISEKWDGLSTNTQRYIATIAAGSRQQSRFIAMMADYKRTMELVGLANNAAGASEEQFAKTQDSLQSKLNRLKNAWDEFTMGLANNKVIKVVVDLLTGFINIINKLTKALSFGSGLLKSFWDVGALLLGIKLGRAAFNGFFGWLLKTSKIEALKAGTSASVSFGTGLKKGLAGIKKIFTKTTWIDVKGIDKNLVAGFNNAKQRLAEINNFYANTSNLGTRQLEHIAAATKVYEQSLNKVGRQLVLTGQYQKVSNLLQQEGVEVGIANIAAKKGLTKTEIDQIKAEGVELGLTEAQIKQKIREAAVTKGLDLTEEDLLQTEHKGLLTKAQSIVWLIFGTEEKKRQALANLGLAASEKIADIEAKSLAKTLYSLPLGWILGMVVALTAAIIGIVAISKQVSLSERMKEAEEATKRSKEAADKAKEAYNDLLTDKSDYQELQKALEDLTYGTQEWKEKLIEVNQQVLELINKYPELAKNLSKGSFGQLTINSEGWDSLIDSQQEAVIRTQGSVAVSQAKSTDLKNDFLYNELGEKLGFDIVNSLDLNNLLDGTASIKQLSDALAELGVNSEEAVADILAYTEGIKSNDLQMQSYAKALFTTSLSMSDNQQLGTAAENITNAFANKLSQTTEKDINERRFNIRQTRSTKEELAQKYGVDLGANRKNNLEAIYAAMTNQEITEVKQLNMSKRQLAEEIAKLDMTDEATENFDKFVKQFGGLSEEAKKAINLAMSEGADYLGEGVLNESQIEDIYKANESVYKLIYGELEDFKKAYELAVENGKKEISKSTEVLKDLGIQITQSLINQLNAGSLSGLTTHLSDIFATSGRDAANQISKSLNNIVKNLDTEDVNKFVGALNGIDWTSAESIESFSEVIEETGLKSKISEKDVNSLEVQIIELGNAARKVDLEAVTEQIRKLSKLGLSLKSGKQGNSFSKEDRDLLVEEAGISAADFIYNPLEDTYMYMGESLDTLTEAVINATTTIGENTKVQLQKDVETNTIAEDVVTKLGEYDVQQSADKYFQQLIQEGYTDSAANTIVNARYGNDINQQKLSGIQDFISQTGGGAGLISQDELNKIKNMTNEQERAAEITRVWNELTQRANDLQDSQNKLNQYALDADITEKMTRSSSENQQAAANGDTNSFKAMAGNAAMNGADLKTLTEITNAYNAAVEHGSMQLAERYSYMMKDIEAVYADAQAHDISTEELNEYISQLKVVNSKLKDNEAAQIALANAKYNKGLKKLVDGYEDWTKILDKTGGKLKNLSSEDAKIIKDLKSSVEDMFDLTSEQSTEFIKKHKDLIKEVAEGSQEALVKLREIAAKEFLMEIPVEVKTEEAEAAINAFNQFLEDYDLPPLEPGMDLSEVFEGTDQFIALCNQMMSAAGYSVGEMNAIFSRLGFTPDWSYEKIPVTVQAPQTLQAKLKTNNGYTQNKTNELVWEKLNSEPATATGYITVPKLRMLSGNGSGGGSMSYASPSSSGGGGGGSSSETETWENPYDWLYNLTQKINAELRTREKLERRYQRLVKTYKGSGAEISQITKDEIASLEKRKKLQEEMLKLREKELRDYLAANAEMQKFATYDWNLKQIQINWEAINAITDKDEGAALKEFIDKLEEIHSSMEEAEDAIEDISDEIIDIRERGRQEYQDLEDRVLDALIDEQQDLIDEQERIYNAINDAASNLMDAISKNIEKIRQDRQNEETETSLAEKERRLAYLRQDTTGSNALEIKKLEDELNKEKQNYTDTLIDQGLNDLKEQNDAAAEQREKQIQLMQSQLDWQQETGYYVNEATRIVREGLGPNGVIDQSSRMYKLLSIQEGLPSMSNASRDQWNNDLANSVSLAFRWLQDELGGTGGSQDAANRDIMAEMRAQSDKGRTVNGDMEKLQQLENERNQKIRDTGVQDTWQETAMVNNYKRGKSSYNKNTESGTDWMALIDQAMNNSNWEDAFFYAGKRDAKIEQNPVGASYASDFTFDIVFDEWYKRTGSHTFKTGGLADFTGPAWLDGTKSKPEMVLNAKDTENFLQLKDILSNLRMSFSGSKGALGGDWYFDIDINVGEIANDYDVDQLTERVKQSIYTESTYRNVNAINFLK